MPKVGYWLLAVGCWIKNTLGSKKIIAFLQILIFIVLPCFFLTGCYDATEVDELGYVLAVGLDKGKTNYLRMTLQIAIPRAIGGNSEGGGDGGDESFVITTVETASIWSGLNMVNNYASRQLNLSHSKVLIISEELAREGVGKYLHAMMRNKEFRPNMHVMISRTSAEEYINSVKPEIELSPAKYYELNFRSANYTALTIDETLSDFYFSTKSTHQQAVAVLGSINKFGEDKEIDIEAATHMEKGNQVPLEGDFKAGDIPRKAEFKSEIMGIAVFDGQKMVGDLDGSEATAYLMVTGEYKHAFWTLPDPLHKNQFIGLDIRQNRRPKISVRIVDGKPYIDLKLNLEANIQSIQSGENYEDPKKLNILENSASNFAKEQVKRTLDKVAHEYKSDIFAFGKKAKGLFLTWDEWKKFHWLEKFKDARFSVQVNLTIRRTGLMIRSMPFEQVQE